MTRLEDIEKQAATWVARFDHGNGGDRAFAAWLAADSRHRAAYLRVAEAWRRSEALERLRPTGAVIDPDLLAPRRSPGWWTRLKTRGAPRAFLCGAAATGIMAAAFALWWALGSSSVQTYRTQPGGLYRVVLADGTAIILNADTSLRVRYGASKRTVTLVRGEAQFLVAHDAQRPFQVLAEHRIVRDVGTHFDVRLDASQSLEVLVTAGRVVMMAAGVGGMPLAESRTPMIDAGELAYAKGRQVTIRRLSRPDIERRLAWKHRELNFRGETLGNVIAEFNRYNSRKLVIVSPVLQNLQIGGNFEALDMGSFVAALRRTFGISAEIHNGQIYLSSTDIRSTSRSLKN
jgi:transmembrane sensor